MSDSSPLNLHDLIKNTRIFASLSAEVHAQIASKCQLIELQRSHILFHRGDASDAVYLLIAGKLVSEIVTGNGEVRKTGYIEAGETVGELGALVNDTRSLTIRAVSDAKLVKIAANEFSDICRQYPSVLFAILNPIVVRTNDVIQMLSAGKSDKHIVVLPGYKNVSLKTFYTTLQTIITDYHHVTLISEYQEEYQSLTYETIKEQIRQMSRQHKVKSKIIYFIDSYHHPLTKVALKNADMVYIVVNASDKAQLDRHAVKEIEKHRAHLRTEPALILLHAANTSQPINTRPWLETLNYSMYHHLRLDHAADFKRLLRFIRGKARALVLSGGGTRGWAHVGVIKALQESKIPIDILGGTSIGAIICACYATSQTYSEMTEKFRKIVSESDYSVSWRSLTWPTVSLFNAKNFTNAQINAFGESRIEDQWVPIFFLSCNLGNNTETIHTQGLIWEAVRASSALPGIVPPMVVNGELHVDGGLLNNLPVDTMRNLVGPSARIYAVELNSFNPKPGTYSFPPILTLKEAIFIKFGWSKNKYNFPSFTDTFLQSLFVGSLSKSKQNGLSANVLVSLNLNKYKLLHANETDAKSMIEIGYKQTMGVIAY